MKHFDTWCFSELKNILPVIAHLIGGSAHVLRSAEHEWSNVVGYVRSTNWVVCHVENARTSLEFFFNWAIAPRATAIHCLLLQRDTAARSPICTGGFIRVYSVYSSFLWLTVLGKGNGLFRNWRQHILSTLFSMKIL